MNKEYITKEKALISFARAKKSIAKTIRMVESSKPCLDIMKQNSATVALLRRAHEMLMERGLNSYFKIAINKKRQSEKLYTNEKILRVAKMFNR